jgi:hypothetical protein
LGSVSGLIRPGSTELSPAEESRNHALGKASQAGARVAIRNR